MFVQEMKLRGFWHRNKTQCMKFDIETVEHFERMATHKLQTVGGFFQLFDKTTGEFLIELGDPNELKTP